MAYVWILEEACNMVRMRQAASYARERERSSRPERRQVFHSEREAYVALVRRAEKELETLKQDVRRGEDKLAQARARLEAVRP